MNDSISERPITTPSQRQSELPEGSLDISTTRKVEDLVALVNTLDASRKKYWLSTLTMMLGGLAGGFVGVLGGPPGIIGGMIVGATPGILLSSKTGVTMQEKEREIQDLVRQLRNEQVEHRARLSTVFAQRSDTESSRRNVAPSDAIQTA